MNQCQNTLLCYTLPNRSILSADWSATQCSFIVLHSTTSLYQGNRFHLYLTSHLLRRNRLHNNTVDCTALNSTALNCTEIRINEPHYNPLQCTAAVLLQCCSFAAVQHQTQLNHAVQHFMTLHDTALHHSHRTWLYHIVLHCTAVHCTTLYYTIYNTIFYLRCNALPCLQCSGVQWTALYSTALHPTALHCTALHCTALQCTPLRPTAPCFFDMQTLAGLFSPSWLLIFSSWITAVLHCTLPNNGGLWEPQKM